MSCPDLSALARAGKPQADPTVVEHIRRCDSCWLDWQIQQGTRLLLDPQVKAAADLDERIVAQAAIIARHSDRPARWRRLAVTGALVGIIVFLLLLLPSNVAAPMQVPYAAFFALAGGVTAALYFRRKDEKECGVARRDKSVDGTSL